MINKLITASTLIRVSELLDIESDYRSSDLVFRLAKMAVLEPKNDLPDDWIDNNYAGLTKDDEEEDGYWVPVDHKGVAQQGLKTRDPKTNQFDNGFISLERLKQELIRVKR